MYCPLCNCLVNNRQHTILAHIIDKIVKDASIDFLTAVADLQLQILLKLSRKSNDIKLVIGPYSRYSSMSITV